MCSHQWGDGTVFMSSGYVKLWAGNQDGDEPRIQLIVFDRSIQELRKDLKWKSDI